VPGPSLAACRAVRDQSALVLAAANTAASWARARRANWDGASNASSECESRIADCGHLVAERGHFAEAEGPAPVIPFQQTPSIPIDQTHLDVRPTARVPVDGSRRAAVTAGTAGRLASKRSRLARWLWLPSGSFAAVVLALGGTACAYWLRPPRSAATRPAVVNGEPARPRPNAGGQQSTVPPPKPTGMMFVTSDPVGARVLVDGRPRGVTPITVTDLTPADHALVLDSPGGSVRRSVTIVANETARVAESIFAGWVSVLSPFEVAIAEGTRGIQLDDRNQAMLGPGPHELHIENRALGYEELRKVFVKPGEITALSIAPPRSTISVTATAPASVWVDGSRVGETPIAALPLELGTHDVVVRHAEHDERRFAVTATMKPILLNADFSKP